MSFTTSRSVLNTGNSELEHWKKTYGPGQTVQVSGIYRCIHCNHEVTCNRDDPFPPQNHAQHPGKTDVVWKLNVMTETYSKK